MIIHHKEDFSQYSLNIHKELKSSDSFIFVPLSIVDIQRQQTRKCIFQTPLLFSPYGIQETQNHKKIIDLSFQNKENDNEIFEFLNKHNRSLFLLLGLNFLLIYLFYFLKYLFLYFY